MSEAPFFDHLSNALINTLSYCIKRMARQNLGLTQLLSSLRLDLLTFLKNFCRQYLDGPEF